MSLLSPEDDDRMSSLIRAYNSMDPYQRSEFLDARGTTRPGWQAEVAAHERRRRAARESPSSTDASRAGRSAASGPNDNGPSEGDEVVFTVRVPSSVEQVELLLDAGESSGNERPSRGSSAPPARGPAATGPGRRRSDDSRRSGPRGRSGAHLIRIVIVLPGK